MMTLDELRQLARGAELHHGTCRRIVGPRGGIRTVCERWRVNGRLQSCRNGDFRLPIKYGLYRYGAVRPWNVGDFHPATLCPLETENGFEAEVTP